MAGLSERLDGRLGPGIEEKDAISQLEQTKLIEIAVLPHASSIETRLFGSNQFPCPDGPTCLLFTHLRQLPKKIVDPDLLPESVTEMLALDSNNDGYNDRATLTGIQILKSLRMMVPSEIQTRIRVGPDIIEEDLGKLEQSLEEKGVKAFSLF